MTSRLLVAILIAVSVFPFSAPVAYAQEEEEYVTDVVTEWTISKDQVFANEVFTVTLFVSLTLVEDLDFSKVVDVEYIIKGELESGETVTLTSGTMSLGPFTNLEAGTRLNLEILDVPLIFPSDADPGSYTLWLEITKLPEVLGYDVAGLVEEHLPDMRSQIGTITYLGVSTPEILLTISADPEVNAGGAINVDIGVTAPELDEVEIELLSQRSGYDPVSIETFWVATLGSVAATLSELVTAPIYEGNLSLTVQATSARVAGAEFSVPPNAVSTWTAVTIGRPTFEVAVDNPVSASDDLDFTLEVRDVATAQEKLVLDIYLYLVVPLEPDTWTGWDLISKETVTKDVLGGGVANTFDLSTYPPGEEGTYLLLVECSLAEVEGTWVALEPPLEASATVVTTGVTDPAVTLELDPESVYPGETFDLSMNILNPNQVQSMSVTYEVYKYVGDQEDTLFEGTAQSLADPTVVLAAGEEMTVALGTYTPTDVSGKYIGFEVRVTGYTLGGDSVSLDSPLVVRTTGYVKEAAPPAIEITPSASNVEAGESLGLCIKLKNVMSVETTFDLDILQQIEGEAETLIDTQSLTLSPGEEQTLALSVDAPDKPCVVRYGAEVSSVTIGGEGFAVAGSAWCRVEVALVLPQLTLSLSPNPVIPDSTLNISIKASNPSSSEVTTPVDIYLKQPGVAQGDPWRTEEVTIPAGGFSTVTKYVEIGPEWEELGSVTVIAEIDSLTLGESSVPLDVPISASATVTVVSLELGALLTATVDDVALSYQGGYLKADSVHLQGSIIIRNLGGWENCPNVSLQAEVTGSEGVTMTQDWSTADVQTNTLVGEELSLDSEFTIENPTQANLANVEFEMTLIVAGVDHFFTFGIVYIQGEGWRLDAGAQLVDRATGQKFASPEWDSDGDGWTDYQEMIFNSPPTDPLEPNALTPEQLTEAVNLLIADIAVYSSEVGVFEQTVDDGGVLHPSAVERWLELKDDGTLLTERLENLNSIGGFSPEEYSAQSEVLENLDQTLDSLGPEIDDKYGVYAIPKQRLDQVEKAAEELSQEELAQDPDGDGLPTHFEMLLGYDPYDPYSQSDRVNDGEYYSATVVGEEGATTEEVQDLIGTYSGCVTWSSVSGEGEYLAQGKDMWMDILGLATWNWLTSYLAP